MVIANGECSLPSYHRLAAIQRFLGDVEAVSHLGAWQGWSALVLRTRPLWGANEDEVVDRHLSPLRTYSYGCSFGVMCVPCICVCDPYPSFGCVLYPLLLFQDELFFLFFYFVCVSVILGAADFLGGVLS